MKKLKKANVYCDDDSVREFKDYYDTDSVCRDTDKLKGMVNEYYGLNKESNLFVDVCVRIAYEKYGLIVDCPEKFNYFDCLEDVLKYLELFKEKKDIENKSTINYTSEVSYIIHFNNEKDIKKYWELVSKMSKIETNILKKVRGA